MVLLNASLKDEKMQVAEEVSFPKSEKFLTEIQGKKVKLFKLENKNGLRADITNYGGHIVCLFVPDKNGVFDDIVTGYHSIDEYINDKANYFGAIIGRYGNRIANGKFSIDGMEYNLAINNPPNHLHGGLRGFNAIVWDGELINNNTLKLSYTSPHMEEGYPGNLNVEVIYRLTDDNEFQIIYNATTDKKTVVNLTSHAYFNLEGEGNNSIKEHYLKINAKNYTPVDDKLIPSGEIALVAGTPFDLTDYTKIGENIDNDHDQIKYGNGYDHNFVLNTDSKENDLYFAASVYEKNYGRKMDVYTSEPGVQLFTGNSFDCNVIGKKGKAYSRNSSFCLETQHFPDSPNKPNFPSTLLKPNERYYSKTIYKFSTII